MRNSGKFRVLAELLPELKARGSRPLIFSQWTAVLDIIEWLLQDLQLTYVRLDGSTAVAERLATVDTCATALALPRIMHICLSQPLLPVHRHVAR